MTRLKPVGLALLFTTACTAGELEGVLQLRDSADTGSMTADSGSLDAGNNGGPDGAVTDSGGPTDSGLTDLGVVDSGGPADTGAEADTGSPVDTGPIDNWPAELAGSEAALLVLLNQFRATDQVCGGRSMPAVGPVVMQADLRRAARDHSQDMGEQNYFDHESLDGRSPWDRIAETGYPGRGVAENIAAGNASAQATFQQWVTSSGHCLNMMSSQANEVGIGHAQVSGSEYRHYWTQVFGRN